MKLLRSILSVVASYIVVFGIVLLSDPVLERLFPTQYVAGKVPPLFLLWVTTAIYFVASILGGWLCARLAPARPGRHLVALFILGELLGAASTIANWGKWPHWHALLWMGLWPLCLWIGGRLGRLKEREHLAEARTS